MKEEPSRGVVVHSLIPILCTNRCHCPHLRAPCGHLSTQSDDPGVCVDLMAPETVSSDTFVHGSAVDTVGNAVTCAELTTCGNVRLSASRGLLDPVGEFGDLVVDGATLGHEVPDLAVCVNDGGVVSAAELLPDLGE
jgi:hypothetical protein